MPRIRFPERITETAAELAAVERTLRGQPTQPRVQMLRFLKSGEARSLLAVAPLVGYSTRTVNRWWALYRAGGMDRLLEQRPRPGSVSQLTEAVWADLAAVMLRGEIATLKDAQRYLREQHGISYRSLHGIWWQLRKRKARPKTGRRRHRQADATKQANYKTGVRDAPHGARLHERVGLR